MPSETFCRIVASTCLIIARGTMKNNILQDYCIPFLVQNCFRPVLCPEQYSPVGRCWEIALALGEGGYWVYAEQDLFDIKIHGFYFHEDFCLEMDIPECISLQR